MKRDVVVLAWLLVADFYLCWFDGQEERDVCPLSSRNWKQGFYSSSVLKAGDS